MKLRLRGLVAAPFTPFLANGDLAEAVVPQQAQRLARDNVVGAFICGSTGEGSSLTNEERRRMTELWCAARPAALKVIVHVGHNSLREAAALAAHAEEKGADAIAMLAPSYFKPASAEALVACCAQVAAAAPKTPFYYYHIPVITGVSISTETFIRLAHQRILNLAGVKFTYEDMADFQATQQFEGSRYDVLFGRDELFLESLNVGARGAVGSTYNYAAPLFHRIMIAHAAGDAAAAEQDQARARAFISILEKFGGLQAGKVMQRFVGVDVGPPRLPLCPLSGAQEAALRRELDAIGFFDYASPLS